MKPATEHGRELAELLENWDSYGAKRIDVRAIVAAERFIEERDLNKCPHISPLNDGGVQVDWYDEEGRECEIEFSPDGIPGGVYVEGRSET